MTDYAILADHPSLFPDDPNEYSLVLIDKFKPPDSDDFINKLAEFEDVDFTVPAGGASYTDYAYQTDGETFAHDDWPPDESTADSSSGSN
jgi:hypothetical protein